MDVVSAAVICSSSTAMAPGAAGAVLAPMVVSMPAAGAHEPHAGAMATPSVSTNASASATCISKATMSEFHHKAMHAVPFQALAPTPLESTDLEDKQLVKEEAQLNRGLSLISLQQAPELTSVEEGEEDLVADLSSLPLSAAVSRQHPFSKLAMEAIGVLRANDLGGYTIPATGLYPYQWNWDSALVAMGWSAVDEPRAWEELEKLFSAQWQDGMVPHIVFHKASPSYFPGPEIWGYADKPMKSTGITQPPIASTAVRRILENQLGCGMSVKSGEDDWDMRPIVIGGLEMMSNDEETSSSCSASCCRSPGMGDEDGLDSEAWAKASELFPKLMQYHRWFFSARDPEKTGLVATLHPWESGMDNSPAWDAPLANVPVDNIPPYTRRDLGHVDAAMRPHQAEYDRYLTLLYRFRNADYDPAKLYWISPFRVTDVCTNSLLHRANLDLRWLAINLNRLDCVAEIDSWLAQTSTSFATLWDEESGIFRSKDQLTGEMLQAATSGGFLPLFARVATPEQAAKLAVTLEKWMDAVQYGVPSLDPTDPRFEGLRYWRGPVWAIVNYMITDGLRFYGYTDLANKLEQNTLDLVRTAGLYEYYDPITGKGAGGSNFSWTAAMVLSWLDKGAQTGNASPEDAAISGTMSITSDFV